MTINASTASAALRVKGGIFFAFIARICTRCYGARGADRGAPTRTTIRNERPRELITGVLRAQSLGNGAFDVSAEEDARARAVYRLARSAAARNRCKVHCLVKRAPAAAGSINLMQIACRAHAAGIYAILPAPFFSPSPPPSPGDERGRNGKNS